MNLFRIGGDLLHIFSFFVLFAKMINTRSVEGISLKTQELYLLVFVSRYLDIFNFVKVDFLHIYNFVIKVWYLFGSGIVVYYMRFKNPWKSSYRSKEDSFRHWLFAVLPCAILALLFHSKFTVMEIMWTFSIYLEAIAILPQLIIVQRYGNVENLVSHYIFALGGYRLLYIMNWIDRYMTEKHYHLNRSTWIVWVAGFVQTLLYCDFFYYYALSKYKGRAMLPK